MACPEAPSRTACTRPHSVAGEVVVAVAMQPEKMSLAAGAATPHGAEMSGGR